MRKLSNLIALFADAGLRCHMGAFAQLERSPGLRPMVWTVLVITLQALETDLKVVVVQLEEHCEVHRDDRRELEASASARLARPGEIRFCACVQQ